MTKEKIISYLSDWDGKHTAYLTDLFDKTSLSVDALLDLLYESEELEKSTTWLIKHLIENGHTLTPLQVEQLMAKLGEVSHWESQLHLLQIVPRVQLSKPTSENIEPLIWTMLQSENKFVKAAAYDAYSKIADLYPDTKHEFLLMCENALIRESASVKVKVRRILKRFDGA